MALLSSVPDEAVFLPEEVRSAYQPIVRLATGEVVAAEALARWPRLGVNPSEAFERARVTGRVGELDTLCQRSAMRGAQEVSLPRGFRLFVNVEAGQPGTTLVERSGGPAIVAEITERSLLDHPSELLRSIRAMRAAGCGIALDDVGAVPESLALLPFIAPDVIKLDMSLVQAWPSKDQARIITAVTAYSERSGATLLAEGVETQRDVDRAFALGATLAQGWYFSRPGPLQGGGPLRHPLHLPGVPDQPIATPIDAVPLAKLRVGSKRMLLGLSRHIEEQGLSSEIAPLVLACFQTQERFTPATVERYRHLAARCPLVVALGVGMERSNLPPIRLAGLDPGDPLSQEWTVVVVGPHYTGALIARDLGDAGPDLDRRFLFTLTHDPVTVLSAARVLLERTGMASTEPLCPMEAVYGL